MEQDWLVKEFEVHRDHLRAVAFRMLGSVPEADDAVQESWIRLAGHGPDRIDNVGGWLTTVVARVAIDMLRARASRREESLSDAADGVRAFSNPEQETALADAVGVALLVVLDRLTPPERLAFVMHDMFGVSFEDIAPIVDKTPAAARQLASRARRRVRGAQPDSTELGQKRAVVEAFLGALRAGDFNALLAVLDPDVVVRAPSASGIREVRGAVEWARSAVAYTGSGTRSTQPAIVEGDIGAIWAPNGRLQRVLRFSWQDGRISAIDVIIDPVILAGLKLTVLPADGVA
jgi:RNA polymerase sigma factor (sigma-70 family)